VLRYSRSRGVTFLEALNFVIISLVIGGIAMVGVARSLRHAKTAEATGALSNLGKAAAEFYERSDATQPAGSSPEAAHAMRQFPRPARASVPAELASIQGTAYKSDSSEWERSPWSDLHFAMSQKQYYAYSFDSKETGAKATAEAIAEGDLDGDKKTSRFSLAISADASFKAKVAASITSSDSEE
jgi:hypothetical protein